MDLAELQQAKAAAERPEPRSVDDDSAPYVRSYLKLRLLVGIVAFALPPLLWLADRVGSDEPWLRDSLSGYYYSSGRELFVGALCAIGAFLVTYTVADYWLENRASTIAGAAAIVVALFPTPREGSEATQLQDFIGAGLLKVIHFGAAIVFIGLLALISHFFGVREGKRAQRGARSPLFWRRFHRVCSGIIVGAIVFILVTKVLLLEFLNLSDELGFFGEKYLFFGEVAAVYGFAASWLMKGTEIATGFPLTPADRVERVERAARDEPA